MYCSLCKNFHTNRKLGRQNHFYAQKNWAHREHEVYNWWSALRYCTTDVMCDTRAANRRICVHERRRNDTLDRSCLPYQLIFFVQSRHFGKVLHRCTKIRMSKQKYKCCCMMVLRISYIWLKAFERTPYIEVGETTHVFVILDTLHSSALSLRFLFLLHGTSLIIYRLLHYRLFKNFFKSH